MPTRDDHRRLIYEVLARIGHGLGAPLRVELLERLCDAPRTVDELARLVGQPLANVSQHLGVLREAGMVTQIPIGRRRQYQVADAEVLALLAAIRALGRKRGELVQRLLDPAAVPSQPIAPSDLVRRARAGTIVLLDVRDAVEHAAGHLPGAISIPLPELRRRLRELPRDRPILVYCRGPFCLVARDAARMLLGSGRDAEHLPVGVIEWRRAGGRLCRIDAAAGAGAPARRARPPGGRA